MMIAAIGALEKLRLFRISSIAEVAVSLPRSGRRKCGQESDYMRRMQTLSLSLSLSLSYTDAAVYCCR
jgi:hypothetical protein